MTNETKQTAVEWLWSIAYNRELTVEDWQQAKEIEKEQMIEFAMKFMMQDRPIISFYNEIYGGNK